MAGTRGGRKTQQDNDFDVVDDDDLFFDALDFLTRFNIGTPSLFNHSIILIFLVHHVPVVCVCVCVCYAGLCVFQHCWIMHSYYY